MILRFFVKNFLYTFNSLNRNNFLRVLKVRSGLILSCLNELRIVSVYFGLIQTNLKSRNHYQI